MTFGWSASRHERVTVAARMVSRDDEHFPGWACVLLQLVDGTQVELTDKHPVLGTYDNQPGDVVRLDCVEQEGTGDRSTILLLHGVESAEGQDTFDVSVVSLFRHK